MHKITQPGEHLSPEQLDAWTWEGEPLPTYAAAHLAECIDCQQRLGALRQLADDLTIARRSQPSEAALDRYTALFDQGQHGTSALNAIAGWVRAILRWDSRQVPALAGVRSAGTRSYRIIYSTPAADVELWVVPQASFCSLEGDCILGNTKRGESGPLVQLYSLEDDSIVLETEATGDGRFRFARVPAGNYDLWITDAVGPSVVLEKITLP